MYLKSVKIGLLFSGNFCNFFWGFSTKSYEDSCFFERKKKSHCHSRIFSYHTVSSTKLFFFEKRFFKQLYFNLLTIIRNFINLSELLRSYFSAQRYAILNKVLRRKNVYYQ